MGEERWGGSALKLSDIHQKKPYFKVVEFRSGAGKGCAHRMNLLR